MLVAFDPGETTGVCIFNDNHEVQEMLHLSLEELMTWVLAYEGNVDIVVYERFIVFRQKAVQMTGSTMEVTQAVSVIKMFAKMKNARLVVQGPDIKPIALKWSKIKMPSKHSETHKWDAFLHGYYLLRKEGKIKSNVAPIAGRKPSNPTP